MQTKHTSLSPTRFRKFLALLLAVALLMSSFGTTAFATEASGSPAEVVPANLTAVEGATAPSYGHADKYTVDLVKSEDTNPSVITLTAENLKQTTNTAGTTAYWVGIGFQQPATGEASYAYGFGPRPGTIDNYGGPDDHQIVDGQAYDTIYWGASSASDPDFWTKDEYQTGYVSVKVGEAVTEYTVTFNVTLPKPAVTPPAKAVIAANLTTVENQEPPSYGHATKYEVQFNATTTDQIDVTAEGLKQTDNNGDAAGGENYWVGIGLPQPSDGITAHYAYGFGTKPDTVKDTDYQGPDDQQTDASGNKYDTIYWGVTTEKPWSHADRQTGWVSIKYSQADHADAIVDYQVKFNVAVYTEEKPAECTHKDQDGKDAYTYTALTGADAGHHKITCTLCEAVIEEKAACAAAADATFVNTDPVKHWKVCELCKSKIGEADHAYGAWTKNAETKVWSRTCIDCKRSEAHQHTWSSAWQNIAVETTNADGSKTITKYHYHECTIAGCPEEDKSALDGYGPHLWIGTTTENPDGWTITKPATINAPGEQTRTCETCKFGDTAEIAQLASAEVVITKSDSEITVDNGVAATTIDSDDLTGKLDKTEWTADSPLNLTLDVTKESNTAATVTLDKGAITKLVTAAAADSDTGKEARTAVITLTAGTAGTVQIPLEAITTASGTGDATTDVILKVAPLAKDSPLPDKDGNGETVTTTGATTVEVTLLAVTKDDSDNVTSTTEVPISNLTGNKINITMPAPSAADYVDVYVIKTTGEGDSATETLVLEQAKVPVVGSKVIFDVNHLTKFVAVKTDAPHVHIWSTGNTAGAWRTDKDNQYHWRSCSAPGCNIPANGAELTAADKAALEAVAYDSGYGEHNWGDPVITNVNGSTPGKMTYACGTCDTTKEVAITATNCPNKANHSQIATTDTCPVCGTAGTKSTGGSSGGSGGGNTGGGGGGGGGGSTTPSPRPSPSPSPTPGDGTTVTNPDGSTTTTVTDKTTGITTATTQHKNGTVVVAKSNSTGLTGLVVDLSASAITEAGTKPVNLPITALKVSRDRDKAPTISLKLAYGEKVAIAIPVTSANSGTVAIAVASKTRLTPLGVIRESRVSGGYLIVPIENGDTIKVIDNSKAFTDVPSGAWYEKAITYTTARTIFSGVSATEFDPNSPTTRGMLMTVIARLANVDTSGGKPWYVKGMEWAVANGISDGTNPQSNITREQLVTMLWRYYGSQSGNAASLAKYSDAGKTSFWAEEAMAWAIDNGLISGFGNGKIGPREQATRAQVAQIMANLLSNSALTPAK